MAGRRYIVFVFILWVAAVIFTSWTREARAVPSFARQTGMDCIGLPYRLAGTDPPWTHL